MHSRSKPASPLADTHPDFLNCLDERKEAVRGVGVRLGSELIAPCEFQLNCRTEASNTRHTSDLSCMFYFKGKTL